MSDLDELQFDDFEGLDEDDFISDADELDEDIVEIIKSTMNKDGLDPAEFTDDDDDDNPQEQYDDL
jgi:hypothetical protein